MIDLSQDDERNLKDLEAQLNELEREEHAIETAVHIGFGDASRRIWLESEIEAQETAVMHEKERLAAGRN